MPVPGPIMMHRAASSAGRREAVRTAGRTPARRRQAWRGRRESSRGDARARPAVAARSARQPTVRWTSRGMRLRATTRSSRAAAAGGRATAISSGSGGRAEGNASSRSSRSASTSSGGRRRPAASACSFERLLAVEGAGRQSEQAIVARAGDVDLRSESDLAQRQRLAGRNPRSPRRVAPSRSSTAWTSCGFLRAKTPRLSPAS